MLTLPLAPQMEAAFTLSTPAFPETRRARAVWAELQIAGRKVQEREAGISDEGPRPAPTFFYQGRAQAGS